MVSHSSHTIIVNELLILVILVASISFFGSKFVTYAEVLVMMLHIERSLILTLIGHGRYILKN